MTWACGDGASRSGHRQVRALPVRQLLPVPHHKLVDDALRQAQGHYAMVDALFATIAPDRQNELAGLWNGVVSAVATAALP